MLKKNHDFRQRAQKLLSENTLEENNLPAAVRELLEELADTKESEIDFREIVDNIEENIFITDGSGYVLYVNPAYSRNTGVSASDVLHRYVQDIVQDGVFVGGAVLPVLQTKQKAFRMCTTYRSNPPRVGYTVGVPIFDEQGSIKNIVVTSRTLHTLVQLKEEYAQFVEAVNRYSAVDSVKIIRASDAQPKERLMWNSPAMQQVHLLVKRAAPTSATILLTGESGAGKEVVADEIHQLSNRRDNPFVKVNCAAISANLLESELFGYEKGAFSGADAKGKRGLLEIADHGTLLLDEIGEMSIDLQAKLLRVIQSREIRRVGGTKSIPLDVRFIAATNRNLRQCVKDGTFRQDLYYRLRVIPIEIPPLRKRQEDIASLCQFFVKKNSQHYHIEYTLTPRQMSMLEQYTWPGNVRELENVIEYFTICRSGIDGTDDYMLMQLLNSDDTAPNINDGEEQRPMGMAETVEKMEKHMIEDALSKCRNLREAGQLLNVSAPTLSRKIKQYHIEYPRGR